jgi:putative transposase
MKKSKFSESQIVVILKDGEAGAPVAQIMRKHGISQAMYLLPRQPKRDRQRPTTLPTKSRADTACTAA